MKKTKPEAERFEPKATAPRPTLIGLSLDDIKPLDLFNISKQSLGIDIECFSAPRILGIINHLAGLGKTYVEIGTYRGVTLAAAKHNNPDLLAIGIDNYSWPVRTAARNAQDAKKRNPDATIIQKDYKAGLADLHRRNIVIDCLFLDGPHGYAEVMEQFLLAQPLLSDSVWVIIDDTNFAATHRAAHEIASWQGWEVAFERLTGKEKDTHPEWWNGITILKRT